MEDVTVEITVQRSDIPCEEGPLLFRWLCTQMNRMPSVFSKDTIWKEKQSYEQFSGIRNDKTMMVVHTGY